MPAFDTPQPISVTVELGVGDVRITASDRTDTIVEVRPSDAAKKSDVSAAQETRVEYDGGRLLIKAPKGHRGLRQFSFAPGGESIDVQIALPAGSSVRGDAGVVALRCAGRLGEFRLKTGVGEIQLDQADSLQINTGAGDITVHRVLGHAELATGSGAVRIGGIDATGVIKNGNGDTWIGEAGRELKVNAANGTISVGQAHAGVAAKTANGDVRLGEVLRGAVLVETACGKLEVGIREGVAAWLDLNTHYGNVQTDLDPARPEPGEDAVEVRARSAFGDITVRRVRKAQPVED
ncbi:MAG: DUF4097 family beta strand repeat-containing protein [Solirubrobacteraceae bacterium]